MQPEIVIPVLMSCAMLWWISRGMSWTRRLVVAAVTLMVVMVVLLVDRGVP